MPGFLRWTPTPAIPSKLQSSCASFFGEWLFHNWCVKINKYSLYLAINRFCCGLIENWCDFFVMSHSDFHLQRLHSDVNMWAYTNIPNKTTVQLCHFVLHFVGTISFTETQAKFSFWLHYCCTPKPGS